MPVSGLPPGGKEETRIKQSGQVGPIVLKSLCLRKRDPDPLQKHNIKQLDTCPSPHPPNDRGLGHLPPTDSCSTLIPPGSKGHQEPCTGDRGEVISVLSSHQY